MINASAIASHDTMRMSMKISKYCDRCQTEYPADLNACPICGGPSRARLPGKRWGYEWKSQASWFGIPLIHVAIGRDRRGKLRVAKGFIAIGQFAIGAITVAQFGVGIIFGIGQFIVGPLVIAQIAFAALFGIGQFAVGYYAIGQIALGVYVLCQTGWGVYMWTPSYTDMEAVARFHTIYHKLRSLGGI